MLVYTSLSRIVFYIIEKGQAFETLKICGRGIARPFLEQDMFRESGIRKGKKSGMSLTVVKRINKICRIIVETIACFGSILCELHNSKIKNAALKRKSYCFAQSCGTLFSPFVWIKTT